ncbi:hypothetical protein [Nocardia terpenica]|uniref:Uncharacterized protein n=1 Tax=Nocardia terpenica TaxID=455432 RepID=A0A6G9Z5D9_9NOCA|nr:hypothetical protein [Nocardia terpenica]QIS20702.1 hypothetical protein F6W96_22715 [Nocardia terpenica]
MREPFVNYLAHSGWNELASVRNGLRKAGLPIPDADYLCDTYGPAEWKEAHRLADALRDRFAKARFADTVDYGPVLIPDPKRLDVRGAVSPSVRADQTEVTTPDFVDPKLPQGVSVAAAGADWTLAVSVIGPAGIALGSYLDITGDDDPDFYMVEGQDTRDLMIRQIWGARTLQCGTVMPDCEHRDSWTFSLLPGEGLVGGEAVSGTVLHGTVRHRLGRADRGIKSARVCPALLLEPGR